MSIFGKNGSSRGRAMYDLHALSNSFSHLIHTLSRRVAGVGVGADTSFIIPVLQTRNLSNLNRITQLVTANTWAPT